MATITGNVSCLSSKKQEDFHETDYSGINFEARKVANFWHESMCTSVYSYSLAVAVKKA